MAERSPEVELSLVVFGRREVADRVVELELGPRPGTALPAWEPGAHVELQLAPDLLRHYSLCGDTGDGGRWRIAVLQPETSRGGSRAVHENLRPGAEVIVRGPRNRFPLVDADHYEFVAGGIGITPLIPMIAEADRRGASWRLTYGGRSPASMAYGEELERRHPGAVELWPQNERGLLDLDVVLKEAGLGTAVFACGPDGLLAALEQRAAGADWTLRLERFVAGQVDDGENRAVELELVDSEVTIVVAPDETLLEAVEKAGVFAMSSCREGICGTCETRVLAGRPEHRDSYLTDEERAEGDVMMICVSRALSDKLTLEL
ncbi:PDR/VanB family oxidoreductase [Actinomadura rugatobispora]|uniref:PDR/VanB family oxidoreductase n=1 Tax=Actinomadura rugatobispora TaxID=1994 RepID=A0ABW0ZRY8_9ACTN|nr:PDR/VanB family oxidoreductase [Actinomadura rugatobispora]